MASEIDDRQRLVEKYTEIASLAGGLAHEIKNPLSTLSLNLQLLAEDFANPQDQRERRALQKIERVQRECKRLDDILNEFLKFCRIGVGDLERQPQDISPLVRELIELQRPALEKSNVVVRDELAPALPPVALAADLFRQALLNLILNAQAAMPDGGELIFRSRDLGDRVSVTIIDTGTGIRPDVLERIYKPFFSTKGGGSGLGLPTTRKIVEAHQGTIDVQTAVGKGTAFTIELPITSA